MFRSPLEIFYGFRIRIHITAYDPAAPDADDAESIWMNILSFFFPIVGIIIWFINRGNKPVLAKGVLKWALIGVVFSLVRYFLFG